MQCTYNKHTVYVCSRGFDVDSSGSKDRVVERTSSPCILNLLPYNPVIYCTF